MCGGGSYSYTPPKPPKDGWYKWWQGIYKAMKMEDVGFFIELVQGCDQISCAYQCQARNLPKKLMSIEEFNAICKFFHNVSHHNLMYYGIGDPGLWLWEEWFAISYHSREKIPNGRINISPLTDRTVINKIAREGLHVFFTPQNIEEATICNMLSRELACRLGGVIIPVNRNSEWLEMAKILRLGGFHIEFDSFTPSWSGNYISAREFNGVMNSQGLNINVTGYKLKSGFKPVIESCKILEQGSIEITMRRCFQLDSRKLSFIFRHGTGIQWEKDENKELYDNLVEFAKSETSCDKCSDVVWTYSW